MRDKYIATKVLGIIVTGQSFLTIEIIAIQGMHSVARFPEGQIILVRSRRPTIFRAATPELLTTHSISTTEPRKMYLMNGTANV